MKPLRAATFLLTVLVVPGGLLLLVAPMAVRAYKGWRRR